MKQFIFYEILLIDDKIFLDSPFGSEKVVIGLAVIESSNWYSKSKAMARYYAPDMYICRGWHLFPSCTR